MDVHLCVFVCAVLCCGLCHELISSSEESYCVCVCVCVCVLNCVSSRNSTMRWPRPNLSSCTTKNDNILFTHVQYIFNKSGLHVSTMSCHLQTLKCQYKRAIQMHFMNNRGIFCTYNIIKYYGMDPS